MPWRWPVIRSLRSCPAKSSRTRTDSRQDNRWRSAQRITAPIRWLANWCSPGPKSCSCVVRMSAPEWCTCIFPASVIASRRAEPGWRRRPSRLRRRRSVLAALQLVDQLGWQLTDDQHVAGFVIFDLRTQQVRRETDRQPLGAAGEATKLVERALVGRKFRGHAVILVADVTVEGLGPFFVDQPRKFSQRHRFTNLRLAAGIAHQRAGFLPGLFLGQVFVLDEIAEGLEQRTGLARTVDPFLATDEVAEILRDLLAVLALDERDVLFGLLVVLPLGDIDPRGQVQLAEIQVPRGRYVQRLGNGDALAVMQQGDGQVIGHALLVMGEQHMAAGGQVGFFHQLL